MDAALTGIAFVLSAEMLLLIFLATVAGVLVGALPGLGSIMMIVLLLPYIIVMEPTAGIVLTAVIYCAATFGGSITSILINTPGTPAAAATTFEGYPMAQRGEAGRALGMAAFSSSVGGIFSVLVLIVAAPLLARVAYHFGPPEYFALALFGLSMLASLGNTSTLKNYIGGAFGILLSTVGVDFATGVERFTFGSPALAEGIHFIPLMIGLFAGSELLMQAAASDAVPRLVSKVAVRLPSLADLRKVRGTIARSSLLGTFVGILPAEGGTVAALMAYNEAKRWSKTPEAFGKGAIEGIAAPESANNAATGGAMVPTLALGIPGSATTAVILGAMIMLGARPGPALFQQQPDFLYAIFGGMLLANLVFLFVGLYGAKLFAHISLVPKQFLWGTVFLLAFIGTYAINNSLFDVWMMVAFSVVGFVMRRRGYSAAPVVMGLILGELVEISLTQSMLMFQQDVTGFFTRPIALLFFALALLGVAYPYIKSALQRRR